ncbi:MAG: response regulator [Nitrospiraceae bacterium]|nr:MAG: response regulator [Nitrospiraceae bacterium]
METKPVLVVDDESDIVELVSYNLKKEGFSVDSAYDGETALLKLKKNSYSLVVLDLMLPGLQGAELCRIIRRDPRISSLPIIMLTAKGEEVDRILGLEIGADDYITKPFSPRELVARVRAVLRRTTEKKGEDKVVRIGNLLVNKETYSVLKNSKPLALSSTEFRLLVYLAERRGKVFSRDQLLDAVWKNEAFVEPRTVDVHIRRLRAQIEDDSSHPEYIKTKRGIGYYMDADL